MSGGNKLLNSEWLSQNRRCSWCGCELTRDNVTTDHVIPLADGGSNYITNKVPSCYGCNYARAELRNAIDGLKSLCGKTKVTINRLNREAKHIAKLDGAFIDRDKLIG